MRLNFTIAYACWRSLRTPAVLLATNLLLAACATGGTANGKIAPSVATTPTFYAASHPASTELSANEAAALAAAEQKALEYGQPDAANPWTVSGQTRGTVRASEPFRIARRDCRRLIYRRTTSIGEQARSQVTVCRRGDNPWEPVV